MLLLCTFLVVPCKQLFVCLSIAEPRTEIKWAHLIELNEKAVDKSGLCIVGSHLKREHPSLTSYSHMNVRLAAQVCVSVV